MIKLLRKLLNPTQPIVEVRSKGVTDQSIPGDRLQVRGVSREDPQETAAKYNNET